MSVKDEKMSPVKSTRGRGRGSGGYARPSKTRAVTAKSTATAVTPPAAPLPKVDLYATGTDEEREQYLTDMTEYNEYKEEAYRISRQLDSQPNYYDQHGDYFEQLFFGNSTSFIANELKSIASEFATRYGSDPDGCGVSGEDVESIRQQILSLIPIIPIARDQARFQILAYLNQLPAFYASIANDRTDKVRFAVFTQWLAVYMPKFLTAAVDTTTNTPIFEDIHDFVYHAMMCYMECHDTGGKIRQYYEPSSMSL